MMAQVEDLVYPMYACLYRGMCLCIYYLPCIYVCMGVYICIMDVCKYLCIYVLKDVIIFLVYKAFLSLAPSYLCKLIMRPLSAVSDRPLRSLVRNHRLVPRSRTSTSQQCAFASAGPLSWNCLPVKTRAQILSSSFSSTPRLLKSFPFPGA